MYFLSVGSGERERETETERQRETETERKRHRERQRETERIVTFPQRIAEGLNTEPSTKRSRSLKGLLKG